MIKAQVYKSTGSNYWVKDEAGHFWNSTLRGKIKMNEITSSNPIAVGDWVLMELDKEKGQGWIHEILPRENHIVRVAPQNRKYQQHIIASNLDQAVIIATLFQPKTSTGFIDRFLITAEAYHIPALLVFNKSDLYDEADWESFHEIQQTYQLAGYETIAVSTVSGDSINILKEKLKNKTSLFAGHSGVGKSSIINLLLDSTQLKVQSISDWSGKGKHTTTFAAMMDISETEKIIDTPGVKEFGIINIQRAELAHYFPEFRKLLQDCRFNNCMHLNEPGCAIKNALENNSISLERYINYCSILESIPETLY